MNLDMSSRLRALITCGNRADKR